MAFTRPKASTTARGYGTAHIKARKQALSRYNPLDPCCLCGQPLGSNTNQIHLDHHPQGGYRGLAHARCNIRDGSRRGAARRGYSKTPLVTSIRWRVALALHPWKPKT